VAPSYEKQLIGQSNNVYVFVCFMLYVILTTLCVNKIYIYNQIDGVPIQIVLYSIGVDEQVEYDRIQKQLMDEKGKDA